MKDNLSYIKLTKTIPHFAYFFFLFATIAIHLNLAQTF